MSIQAAKMMAEPLLANKMSMHMSKTVDLESGKSTTLSSELKSLWEKMTLANVMVYVLQPDNWAACGIIICWIWTLWTWWLAGGDQNIGENLWRDKHLSSVCAGLACTCGLSIGVVYLLRKTQLIDQISQFRALNREYNRQVQNLSGQVEKLTSTNDKLKLELSGFSDLQDNIKAYAEKNGKDFSEIFKKSAEVFEGISNVQDQQQRILLRSVVADIQFMDQGHMSEGVSKMEWKRFQSRLPPQYKAALLQLGITHEMASKGKDDATYEDMQGVIDQLLNAVAQAPAS